TAYPESPERPPCHRDSAEFHSLATIPTQSAANALLYCRRSVLLGLRCGRFRQYETIADTRFGGDEDRLAAARFDLLPKLIDEDAEIFDLVAVFGSPDGLEQTLVRHWLIGLRDEIAQDVEFGRSEAHRVAAGDHGTIREVDFETGNGNAERRGVGRKASAAQSGAHAGHQFVEAEGLRDIIVRAGIERFHFVVVGIAHGDDDDGHIPAAANGAAGGESA